jgi:hypothetical protein
LKYEWLIDMHVLRKSTWHNLQVVFSILFRKVTKPLHWLYRIPDIFYFAHAYFQTKCGYISRVISCGTYEHSNAGFVTFLNNMLNTTWRLCQVDFLSTCISISHSYLDRKSTRLGKENSLTSVVQDGRTISNDVFPK